MGFLHSLRGLAQLAALLGCACCVGREGGKLTLKETVDPKEWETVALDPVFLARQARVETSFFGFGGPDEPPETGLKERPVRLQAPTARESRLADGGQDPSKAFTVPLQWPLIGAVSSPFGMRWGRLHAGIDILAPRGTPIYAAASGQVLTSKRRPSYGNVVIIGHRNDNQTLYAHMLRRAVKEGAFVRAGQLIGYLGKTGAAFGYHTHFETRGQGGVPFDPLQFLPRVADALLPPPDFKHSPAPASVRRAAARKAAARKVASAQATKRPLVRQVKKKESAGG